jgi:hypothetical protein
MNNQKTLRKLIQETRGKFFSISFLKLDGTIRKANGKDFYRRLLADSTNPKAGFNPLKDTTAESFIDRNKEGWISARQERVVSFSCGAIHETF